MKKSILALMIGVALSFSAIAATSYAINPDHTFSSIGINQLGFSFQLGRFNRTSGKIRLDPESATGSIHFTIETASISTGLAKLTAELRGKDFLDAGRYPQITFVADKLGFDNGRLAGADGMLTLRGVSKPLHVTVGHFDCGMSSSTRKNTCGANATATLNRSDFGMDKYVPVISDETHIAIRLEAVQD